MSTMDSALLQAEIETEETTVDVRKLIIHNDDHNTFEWVIETLIRVCRHSAEQAEQCSYIIHSKGKYAVKHGTYNTLRPMKEAIAERGINVTIE
ncbi:MAG TPA: ATP-dependent Clp protease adaptor ClpS [Chitinophagales bacterium]|nr:ATP-dependent Clp protease adaptor ClpS [Chitinophagales bacterium]